MRVLQRSVLIFTRAHRNFSLSFPAFSAPQPLHNMRGENFKNDSQPKRRRREPRSPNQEVLLHDVGKLLAAQTIGEYPPYTPPEKFSEVQVTISELSSTGDGLGLASTLDHVYVVPFTLPGDVVKAKTVKHFELEQYTLTDFIRVITPGEKRDDALVRCPYFSRCAGCQFQMLSYADQLIHKRSVIVRAYQNFSNLVPELVPPIGETIGSPLQYGYRTKLTPHFDGPPGSLRRGRKFDGLERKGFEDVPPIGFMSKARKTIDIEDCPIGTDAVRLGMARERTRVAGMLPTFKKGVTLLLRESTLRKPKPDPGTTAESLSRKAISEETIEHESPNTSKEDIEMSENIVGQPATTNRLLEPYLYDEVKTCITDSNAISTEFVDDFKFSNPAGAFFQNNNSILPKFTAYIREHSLPKKVAEDSSPIKYLIDAYCGSGLFTITLSSLFSSSIGIDIAGGSIEWAKKNAALNKVENASFITADASSIFREVQYSPDETVVVIDPSRKGCDDAFLQQLLQFNPIRVVYVSCNVHTQARDVGKLVHGNKDSRYEIESLRGFDFFPQTSHVESVAILTRSPSTIS